MKKIKYLLVAAALMVSSASFGQQFHLSGTLQNMHLWRGLQIADGGVLAADVSMGLFKDRLKIGLWGGTDLPETTRSLIIIFRTQLQVLRLRCGIYSTTLPI